MAFNMTDHSSNKGGFSGPRLVPTNVPLPAGQHLGVFCTYVEMGEHDQSTKDYPDKGIAPEAQIEFEIPAEEYVFDEKKGAQPLREGRRFPLYANDKANAWKYFCAISGALSDTEARAVGSNPIPAARAKKLPTYAQKGVTSFDQMLGASLLLTASTNKKTRTFKNYLPVGTTLEQVKAAKEAGTPIEAVAVQQVPWTYSNIRPEGVQPNMHTQFGAGLVDLHPNSVGIVRFLWDSPTEEDWKSLYPWMQSRIKDAVNYPGSSVEALVLSLEQAERNGAANEDSSTNEEEDLGPAFPSEAGGMDDIPF